MDSWYKIQVKSISGTDCNTIKCAKIHRGEYLYKELLISHLIKNKLKYLLWHLSILHHLGNKSGNRRTANICSIGYSDLFSLSKEDLTDTLSEFPAAKRLLEEKGRQILTKMGMLEISDEGEEEKEMMEDKLVRIDSSLETLQTKLARLMVELESSIRKMMSRVEQLELQTEGWEGIVAEGAGSETEDDAERERKVGDGKGEQEEEPQGERGEGDGGEEDKDEGKEVKQKWRKQLSEKNEKKTVC